MCKNVFMYQNVNKKHVLQNVCIIRLFRAWLIFPYLLVSLFRVDIHVILSVLDSIVPCNRRDIVLASVHLHYLARLTNSYTYTQIHGRLVSHIVLLEWILTKLWLFICSQMRPYEVLLCLLSECSTIDDLMQYGSYIVRNIHRGTDACQANS